MIILCTRCGADISERPCICRRARPLSNLEAVVATAASMGEVNPRTLDTAARALREKAS